MDFGVQNLVPMAVWLLATTASAASETAMKSKVVKIDLKILISLR